MYSCKNLIVAKHLQIHNTQYTKAKKECVFLCNKHL